MASRAGRFWVGRHALAASATVGVTVLLWVLKGGAPTNLIAQGTLTTQAGAAVTVSRASNKTCSTGSTQDPAQLLVNPETLDTASWAIFPPVTVTANVIAAPDGAMTAEQVNTSTGAIREQGIPVTASVPYTFSVYLQSVGTVQSVPLYMYSDAAGSIIATSTVTPPVGSWQRYSITGTPAAGATTIQVGINNTSPYNVYIANAKLEQAASASAYVSTSGQNNQAVRTLGTNTACVEPAGLSVEPSATNLLLQSQAFASAGWAKGGSTTTANNVTIGPDGTFTGSAVTLSGSDTAGTKNLVQTYTVSASTTYTCSVWLWAPSTFHVRIWRTNHLTWATATVSPTLTLGATPVRYSYTYTSGGSDTQSDFGMGSENLTAYNADTGTFYAWGAQCELGAVATSYIPTTGTTATRLADQATGPSVSSGTRPSFAADFTPLDASAGTASGTYVMELENNSIDRWQLYYSGGSLVCSYWNGATEFTSSRPATLTGGVKTHVACSYDGTNMKVCADGACTSTPRSFAANASYAVAPGWDLPNSRFYATGNLSNLCASATPTGCK